MKLGKPDSLGTGGQAPFLKTSQMSSCRETTAGWDPGRAADRGSLKRPLNPGGPSRVPRQRLQFHFDSMEPRAHQKPGRFNVCPSGCYLLVKWARNRHYLIVRTSKPNQK